MTDFDGTLAAIVDDPAEARPINGATAVLRRLAASFATVAVVSGRPASFLWDRLGSVTVDQQGAPLMDGAPRSDASLHLVGLYGMESVGLDGAVTLVEGGAVWTAVIEESARRLRDDAPEGVLVEVKGAAVTVHWRRAPEGESWAADRVSKEASGSGLEVHPGRMSLELRPPLGVDKGTVVRRLAAGCTAVCFLGDDLGDLPAFVELGRLRAEDGLAAVGVAVIDDETAPEVADAADLHVRGPKGALEVLEWLDASTQPTPPA